MAKIKFKNPVESASGKVSGRSNEYYRTNPITGKTHTGTLERPYKGPASDKQLVCRKRFRAVMALVTSRLRDPETKAALNEAFHNQHEIGTLVGFAYNMWKDDVL